MTRVAILICAVLIAGVFYQTLLGDQPVGVASSHTETSTTLPTEPAPIDPSRADCITQPITAARYANNSSTLDETTAAEVHRVITEALRSPCVFDDQGWRCQLDRAVVIVEGHTDHLPTRRHGGNPQLGLDRASPVARLATELGVRVAAIRPYEHPEDSPDEWHERRRVDLIWVCESSIPERPERGSLDVPGNSKGAPSSR
ncbi:MAG: hypothetical protein AAF467_06500 [Actinomycetota bacterium]